MKKINNELLDKMIIRTEDTDMLILLFMLKIEARKDMRKAYGLGWDRGLVVGSVIGVGSMIIASVIVDKFIK